MKIPSGPQALTPEWLTFALRDKDIIGQAKVKSFETIVLGDEQGITGQLVRIILSYNPNDENAPQSIIAKFPTTDPESRNTYFHLTRHYVNEVRFFENIAPKIRLRTPKCYYSALDLQAQEYVLLLEDLAPARSGDWAVGCSLEQAELAIRQIAEFHATWWESPALAKMTWFSQQGKNQFAQAQEKYRQQWQPFLNKMGDNSPDKLIEIGESLNQQLISVLQQIQEPPRTIIHNDYQLGNLFFASLEDDIPLVVIDWQTITIGLGAFDMAYFLGGNVDIKDRRAKEMELLKIYHTILVDRGVRDYSLEQCFDHYRLSMLRCLIRFVLVVGGSSLTAQQEQMFCDAIIPRYIAAVLDLNADELLTG